MNGTRALPVLVVGSRAVADRLRAVTDRPEPPLTVTHAPGPVEADGHGVVLASDPSAVEAIEGGTPVLALADGEGAVAALEAGATATLPPAAMDAPGTVAERLAALARPPVAADGGVAELAEASPDLVAVVDPESGTIERVNGRYEEFYGYGREEITDRGFEGLVAGDGRTPADAATDLAAGGTATVEWTVETADGEQRWLESRLRAATIGGQRRVVTAEREVTGRRQLQRTYRDLFEAVGDGLVVHDPDTGEILDVNERFCRMNGYDRGELIGESVGTVTAPGEEYSFERARERIGRASEEGPQLFEWRNQHADGHTFPVEVHLSLVTVRGSERVLASVREVTERERRERQLRAIVDRIDEAVALSSDGTTVGEPEYLSPAIEEITGIPHEELAADMDRFRAHVHPEDRAGYEAGLAEMVADVRAGEPDERYDFEFRFRRPDGDVRWIHLTAYPLPDSAEYARVAVFDDVTERKRREREYEQVFEGVPEPITVNDPETGEIVDCNEAMCELLGYDREEVLARSVSDISVTEDGYTSERAREVVQRVMATREPETFEWKLETADGEHRWLEVDATPATIGGEERYLSITRDVTERRRREREYEQVFDGVSDAITVHDPATGDIVDANETMCELTGYDRETVLERDIEGLSVTEEGYTGERAREVVQRVMATGESETLDWKIETAGGEHRWLEVNGRPATVGGETRYIAISRDVTERRRREREYEQIFDAVSDAIAVHDRSGEILEVNQSYADLLGYDREAIVEGGVDLVSDTEAGYTADRAAELVERAMAGESVDTFEWAMRTADGERRWFETDLSEATIGGERRALAICRDATERRDRQRRIEEERRKYTTLVEQSTDGVVVVSDGEYVFVNERFAEITGYEESELLGSPVESVFADGYRDLVRERYRQRVEGEDPPSQYDVEVETPEGERLVLELSVSRITHEGEPATMGTFRDVTERKRREEELRRTEQQFRQIAEAVDEVIHLAAPDLSETYYLSPAYEEIWGHPVEEMYEDPLSFEETLHPEDREWYMDSLDRLVDVWTDPDRSGEDVHSYEYRVVRDDDSVRWIDSRIYPIRDEEGAVSRVVSVNRDITDQRRRERTVESFQEATAELTTAGSAADACRTAVAAAADVFGLDAAVHLFEDGALRPAAAGGGLTEPLPEWGAGDDPAWGAFVDETAARAEVEGTPLSVGAGGSALVVSLSDHGVFTAWGGEPPDADTVHLIAATLEGALNHIAGERRLESTREELQQQAERAERMERVAELTRRVEAALTGASDRVSIERTVCRRLVDVEPFVAAWTAEGEAGSDRLTLREAAGVAGEEVERTLGGEADHPAREAWRTGEVAVASELVGGDGWRRELLRQGVQAVCAIPLTYEGITHGVLVVRSEEQGAFDGPGRETVDQLGITIGNAITGIERRRALESDETIELEFRDDGSAVPFARLAAETGCQVRHDRTVRRRDGTISVVYTVIGDVPEDVGSAAERTLPGETEVVRREESEAVVRRDGTTWFGSIVSAYGSVLRRGRATPEQATLVVELPTEADTRQFVEGLKERLPGVELYAKRQHRAADEAPGEVSARVEQLLSERQQEAIETAYRMGYFEWPREHGGQEVAEAMDITQPTLNKHLRVAERKVFDLILDRDV